MARSKYDWAYKAAARFLAKEFLSNVIISQRRIARFAAKLRVAYKRGRKDGRMDSVQGYGEY